jgi:hypothetical protein
MYASDAGLLLGPTFGRLWPPDDASEFAPLLHDIDEAVIRQACQARLVRFHTALERHYPN